jgi:SAM-dependent methyltransferase
MKPSKLVEILSCPGTDNEVCLDTYQYANDEPCNGLLKNLDNQIIGIFENFKFNFINFDAESFQKKYKDTSKSLIERKINFISPNSADIFWSKNPANITSYLKGYDQYDDNNKIFYETNAKKINICFHAHPWSGMAEVIVNDNLIDTVDLYHPSFSVRRRFQIDNELEKKIRIQIIQLRTKNKQSQGDQLIIEGIEEYTNEYCTPCYKKKEEINKGGEFHNRFYEILKDLPSDAFVLDVGGGKRQIMDERYINLDYSDFEEPDIKGDGTCLPIKSNSIDFIYTAAVLEHVKNPLLMGKEIIRVLKPGGKLLANSAFMQPVHSEGQHFFNLTPYGIELVFEEIKDKKIWWTNDFSFVVEWMIDLSKSSSKINKSDIERFIELSKKIEKNTTDERAFYYASGVWLEGVK